MKQEQQDEEDLEEVEKEEAEEEEIEKMAGDDGLISADEVPVIRWGSMGL